MQGRVRSSNLLVLDQTSEKGNNPSRKCPKEVKRMARGHFPEKMAESMRTLGPEDLIYLSPFSIYSYLKMTYHVKSKIIKQKNGLLN